METAEPAQLDVRSLALARGGRVLVQDLTLHIPRGRFVVIAGPSGAGKTSLLSCLAGLPPAERGSVVYGGQHGPHEFRCRLGLVFQHLMLTPNATAGTNALCGLLGQLPWWRTLAGFSREEKTRAAELLAEFELADCERVPVRQLSGGERQRVAVARALIATPEVVLADEPVSHLDTRLARAVLARLQRETRERGCTVLCILHHDELAAEFADSVLTLKKDAPGEWHLKEKSS